MAFALGLPFPQETDAATTLQDAIRTLLGSKPQMNTAFGYGGDGVPFDIEAHKNALVAYRAKIVALMNILEGKVSVPANEPVARAPERKMCGLRKPIAAARSAKVTKRRAA